MYTQLGVLYAKYKEEKLLEHIKLFWSRLNIPTLLVACQQNLHWNEAVFLYTHYDQYDNAIDVMIAHSPQAWKHSLFKEIILQVSNTEIYYKAIQFYLAEHPSLLADLLLDLSGKLDHSRVVEVVNRSGQIALTEKYLLQVQRENLTAVNEAVNELYIDQENYKGLRDSIEAHNNFDQIALAQRLEKHELMEFRRISALLYRKNKRYSDSMDISKNDELWADAMDCAADSKDSDLAEQLLNYFVQSNRSECFAACLYTCYELIRPDVVLELAWRNNLIDFAMPFMIQTFREFHDKLNGIAQKLEEAEKAKQEAEEAAKKAAEQGQGGAVDPSMMAIYNPMNPPLLALTAPGYGLPPSAGGYGGPQYGMAPPINGYGGY
jgi:clathrin heavy chain